jgi:hypothetical protein
MTLSTTPTPTPATAAAAIEADLTKQIETIVAGQVTAALAAAKPAPVSTAAPDAERKATAAAFAKANPRR